MRAVSSLKQIGVVILKYRKMDRKTFKKNLDKEIQKTKDQIESYLDMSQPVAPDNAIGRISRMDAINNQSVQNQL